MDQEMHSAGQPRGHTLGPAFPPGTMFTWAQVLSAFLDGVPKPRDLPVPHSVQHILGEGPSMKTPPKSSHGLSPDTVLTTCNNSLQPHSGPMNQALLGFTPFYRTEAQGRSLGSVAGSVWRQKGHKRVRERMWPLVPASAVTSCVRLNLLEYLCEAAIASRPAYPHLRHESTWLTHKTQHM